MSDTPAIESPETFALKLAQHACQMTDMRSNPKAEQMFARHFAGLLKQRDGWVAAQARREALEEALALIKERSTRYDTNELQGLAIGCRGAWAEVRSLLTATPNEGKSDG